MSEAFERFVDLFDSLIRVPHSGIKKKFDAEKAAKKGKKLKDVQRRENTN